MRNRHCQLSKGLRHLCRPRAGGSNSSRSGPCFFSQASREFQTEELSPFSGPTGSILTSGRPRRVMTTPSRRFATCSHNLESLVFASNRPIVITPESIPTSWSVGKVKFAKNSSTREKLKAESGKKTFVFFALSRGQLPSRCGRCFQLFSPAFYSLLSVFALGKSRASDFCFQLSTFSFASCLVSFASFGAFGGLNCFFGLWLPALLCPSDSPAHAE